MKKFLQIILLCSISLWAEWDDTGKSGIEAIDTLPIYEWDVETSNDNFALAMGLSLVIPGGGHYYTGHYVRAGFITALSCIYYQKSLSIMI